MFSTMAYNLILNNMPILLESKGNASNWLNMQWAAVFAMYGLSNSSSGPAAALSYYLGTHFKVNHGIAGAVFIGKVARFNHENGFYDYSDLYKGSENLTKEEKSLSVVTSIEGLLRLAKIPESLEEFGVNDSDIEGFCKFREGVEGAFKMNPVNINKNDLINSILS
jgi:alcohol dehydrogenase class IV